MVEDKTINSMSREKYLFNCLSYDSVSTSGYCKGSNDRCDINNKLEIISGGVVVT